MSGGHYFKSETVEKINPVFTIIRDPVFCKQYKDRINRIRRWQ